MGLFTLFFIAVGLSMDAFTVAISNGICYQRAGFREAMANGITFGLFQGLMPLLGYFAGRSVSVMIDSVDHWIALILLSLVGGRMIYQAVWDLRHPQEQKCAVACSVRGLLTQGFATSIDALAVGVSFATLSVDLFLGVFLIGITTFSFSFVGLYLGRQIGPLFRGRAEIVGGAILILIGIKIFLEQTILVSS